MTAIKTYPKGRNVYVGTAYVDPAVLQVQAVGEKDAHNAFSQLKKQLQVKRHRMLLNHQFFQTDYCSL